ncbi:hypothetical protein [Planomonospora sp. ID67723]|uniref:hypothetical protein n=1 Tax=Planomonospora sp. ID67723 TaxID=2738134 RepID=UPI0018C3718A|nr:hypothetical protein [Planomonospora sp. ID67723]
MIVDLRVRKGGQPPWIVSDGLWERIEPLLPKTERRQRYPGRKRLDDRKALCGGKTGSEHHVIADGDLEA